MIIYLISCLAFIGCSNPNSKETNNCIQTLQSQFQNDLYGQTTAQLNKWQELRFFRNSSIESQELDSTFFFNNKNKNEFFVGVIQLGTANEKFDAARIIRGTSCNGLTQFEVGMQILFRKSESELSRISNIKEKYYQYVLRQGVPNSECDIDHEYWFASNTGQPKCETSR